MEKLALNGGEKVKKTPFSTGKRFGEEELKELREALEQNTLFYWAGKKVKQLQKDFAGMYGVKYCVTTTSGTASIHVALGALGIGPGDEVITTPMTDMGTVIGILLQNAIPVFADINPETYNPDPASIEKNITESTKAIVVVHLAGSPADMDSIMKIAKKHKLKVIEDCAQSYLAEYRGKYAGTFGDFGCFSLNDFKHISAGDGGMIITNNEELYKKAMRFADKNYDRLSSDIRFGICSLAPNYRMTELQGAVGVAQLKKLKWICDRRNQIGARITEGIKGLKGIITPRILDGCKSTYWFYLFRIDPDVLKVDNKKFCDAMCAEGIPCGSGYSDCVYNFGLFVNTSAYKDDFSCPWACPAYKGKIKKYKPGISPNSELVHKTSVKLEIKEFYSDTDVQDIIKGITKVVENFSK